MSECWCALVVCPEQRFWPEEPRTSARFGALSTFLGNPRMKWFSRLITQQGLTGKQQSRFQESSTNTGKGRIRKRGKRIGGGGRKSYSIQRVLCSPYFACHNLRYTPKLLGSESERNWPSTTVELTLLHLMMRDSIFDLCKVLGVGPEFPISYNNERRDIYDLYILWRGIPSTSSIMNS